MDEQHLKDVLSRARAPEARETAQKQAVDAALAAFDQKIHETAQGKPEAGRLTDRINNLVRRTLMKNNQIKLALKGGVALAVLAVAIGINIHVPQAPLPVQQGGVNANALVNNLVTSSAGFTQLINLCGYVGGLALAVAASVKLAHFLRKNGKGTFTGSLLRFAGAAVFLALPFTTQVMQGSVSDGPAGEIQIVHTANFGGPTVDANTLVNNLTTSSSPVQRLAEATGLAKAPREESLDKFYTNNKGTVTTGSSALPTPIATSRNQGLALPGIAKGGDPLQEWKNNIQARKIKTEEAQDVMQPQYYKDEGRDKFESVEENQVKQVKVEPVSTFSVDVDTASYSFVRRMINGGVLPQKDAVRPEEMINYFPYSYAVPETKEEPFKPTVSVFGAPWAEGHKLIHIGIKGYNIDSNEKPHANLVFLIDTSGSMQSPDKLPLVKNALKMLIDTLNPEDTIGIVTYAGSAGTALEPTKVSEKWKIVDVIETLGAGGSTAGAEGIRDAYNLAKRNLDKDGVNRVILATDGDFNVGITNQNELKSFIERERETGIFLSVLGVGQGNYQDALMQALAQNGNGVAAYIDTLSEARKVLVEESSSTLFTIAKDVKIQVEFNPAKVAEYRLIGYETRPLNREDFNNDKVDAGDIGAGHAVTAIYEITPVGAKPSVDPLRYGEKEDAAATQVEEKTDGGEYAFLKIRYKLPNESTSKLITRPITASDETALDKSSDDTRFATAVAGFAQLLKGSKYSGSLSYDDVIALANGAKGRDDFGYRAEFVNLVRLAKSASTLSPQER